MTYMRSIMELESGVCVERCIPAVTKSRHPLLFVHGNFHGSWMWRNFLEYFSAKGVSCYAINFRGHWLSRGHAGLGKAVPEDYVQDVHECLAAIGGEAILIGHSMGGVVSQKAAEGMPLKKLILLDSAPCKAMTEGYLELDRERKEVTETTFIPQNDGTLLWAKDRDKTRVLLFEKNKVSNEALSETVDCLGRESALVLQRHAMLAVDPGKITCPVYVLGRTGLGNRKNPNLWDALADYLRAAGRCIRGDMSHNMMLEDDWPEHAALIHKWCSE